MGHMGVSAAIRVELYRVSAIINKIVLDQRFKGAHAAVILSNKNAYK